jgi:hypothetical protein
MFQQREFLARENDGTVNGIVDKYLPVGTV